MRVCASSMCAATAGSRATSALTSWPWRRRNACWRGRRRPCAERMTYSIVARDPVSGDLGVAVQSHWFSVGTVVTWAEAGVGAVATQAFAEPAYGPKGLALMRLGVDAQAALTALVSADELRARRQVAFVDANGAVAVHTGDQ